MNPQATGSFIKRLRKEKDLSQKDLAQKLNCTDKAISRWETGKGFPDVSYLLELSSALDVSINELLIGERIAKEEVVQKSNEALVKTIDTSNKKVSKLNIAITALFCVILMLAFYLSVATMSPGDEMGVILYHILADFAVTFVFGLTTIKLKYIFPIFAFFAYIPVIIYFADTDLFIYAAIFLVGGYALILILQGIISLLKLIYYKVKNKYTNK